MRPRQSGVTLAELLVAAFVGALVLTCVTVAFGGTWRLMAWVGARSDMDSSALQGLTALSRDLRASAYQSLTIVAAPPSVAFQVQDPVNQDLTTFSPGPSFVVYTYDSTQQALVRKVWTSATLPALSPDPLVAGTRMTAAQVPQVVAVSNPADRVEARGVTAFVLAPATFPSLTPISGVQCSLTVRRLVNSDTTRPVQETVSVQICPRNHP